MATGIRWQEQASCFEHPELPADAWMELGARGCPDGPGAFAMLVCLNVCPVADECRKEIEGTSMIAGRGWWNQKAQFVEAPGLNLVTLEVAAAYAGVKVSVARRRLRRKAFWKGRGWFHMDDVQELAEQWGPAHGTTTMSQLHHYRGEKLCHRCREIAATLALVA